MEIKASVVQYERNIRRDRLQRVADYKFKHYELTGNVPYGYDGVYEFADGYKVTTNHALSELELMPEVRIHGACRSKKLVDNLPEQQWIHTIHLWRFGGMKVPTNRSSLPPTGGMSLKQIANELNRRGSRNRWQRSHPYCSKFSTPRLLSRIRCKRY